MLQNLAKLGMLLAAFIESMVLSATATAAPTLSAKPLIVGLISMGDASCTGRSENSCVPDNSLADAYSLPNVLSGYVINVTWAQLQPNPDKALQTEPIDQALANLAAYNRTYPAHTMTAILRVASGALAPDWVKALRGGPVVTFRRKSERPLLIPLFWTSEYQKAWRELQGRLAARYDHNSLLAQVSNTSCSHQTNEPYVNATDRDSAIALFRAGYTNEAYRACLLASIHDYDAWKTTRVDFTQNTFEEISPNSTRAGGQAAVVGHDLDTTVMIMRAFRQALGDRAIISNHNLHFPPFPQNVGLYQSIRTIGPPIEFQTSAPGATSDVASTGTFKDWGDAINLAVDLGATGIELWRSTVGRGSAIQDGWNPEICNDRSSKSLSCAGQDPKDLARWTKELRTNAAGAGR